MKRILIEFFDIENLNNIISQLHRKYDKIIYLYYDSQRTANTEQLFISLTEFNRKAVKTETEYIRVEEDLSSFDSVYTTLELLMNSEDYFEFDITGGPRTFILAAGKLYESSSASISFHEYNIFSGRYVMSEPKEECPEQIYNLTVRDIIRLHGTSIEPNTKYKFDITQGTLADDIRNLWNAVSDIPNEWNFFCTVPQRTYTSGNRLYIAKRTVSQDERKKVNNIIEILDKHHLVTDIRQTEIDGEKYTEFQPAVNTDSVFLYEKGGNILEMYTYLVCKSSGTFKDCCVTIKLDWDCIPNTDVTDTRNEIDNIVSDGKIPLFISCKNTATEKEYLYEIETLALHYGGRYAKAAIISSVPASLGVRKRAKAMNIALIDNVSHISEENFTDSVSRIL